MNQTIYFISVAFLIFTACKPPHHPMRPNYGIVKPKVKYTPPNKKTFQKW
jgi:hypothetical protein